MNNGFGLIYDTTPFSSGVDYVLSIFTNDELPIRIGESVRLESEYWIDQSIFPIGSDISEYYEWKDKDGNTLSTEDYLVHIASNSGILEIKLLILLKDSLSSFEISMEKYYSLNIQDYNERLYRFKNNYKSINSELIYSNMDIYRFLTYFPMWSSSYQIFFSNTSKLISPHLERNSFILENLNEILVNNNSPSSKIPFGFRDKWYKILSLNTPKYINTEYGICVNMGETSTANINNISIGGIKKKISNSVIKMSKVVFAGSTNIRLSQPSVLYIKPDLNRIILKEEVFINGINKVGDFLTEKVILSTSSAVETINEYIMITRVTGASSSVTISNFIEADISYIDKSILGERICNKKGIYFTPYYEVEQNTLLINNSNNYSRNEEYKFHIPVIPDSIIINNLNDILILKDGELFSSKLMLNYYKLFSPNSSTNNNSYIYTEDENAEVGTVVNIVINTSLLKEDSYNENIQVAITNDNNKYFLDREGALNGNTNTWIPLSSTGDRIVLSVNIENKEDYIFSLTRSSRAQKYFAMVYQNILELNKIDQNISEIFIHNKELIIIDNDLNTSIATPIRLGFTTSDNYIYIQNDFDNIRLMYEG